MVRVDFPVYALSIHKQNALRITKGNNSLTELALFILIQMFILWISLCLQSLMKFYHCLFKILRKKQNVVDKELQRAITPTELDPNPYFSIINVHLVDIIVFAKCDEILSLPIQDIEEKQNFVDKELQRAITPTELDPNPYFSIINVHLMDTNVFAKSDEIPSLPVQVIKEKPKCCGLKITKGNNSKRIGP